MVKLIRYALASVCFAASVGGLALWWRSSRAHDSAFGPTPNRNAIVYLNSYLGSALISVVPVNLSQPYQRFIRRWYANSGSISPHALPNNFRVGDRMFGRLPAGIFFPLWYPAITFALAGVGVLRFRRQFSIRSALIFVSVVAVLLGMVVVL